MSLGRDGFRLRQGFGGTRPRRPIFLLVTEANDSSDGTDVSAEVRPLPHEGGGRPSLERGVLWFTPRDRRRNRDRAKAAVLSSSPAPRPP
jgi:hypothetical protein